MTQIFLIGYRGSGKSTVGRQLAHALNRQFVDTDDEIERLSQNSIAKFLQQKAKLVFAIANNRW